MTSRQSRERPVVHADNDGSHGALRDAVQLTGPEHLVALGFRHWMRGRREGSVGCWAQAWNLYSASLGVSEAQQAILQLSQWVGVVDASCTRDIEILPGECPRFCRDECIAVSMIAACQHNSCPALRACAFALVDTSFIDSVVGGAHAFASTMAGLDQILSPRSIIAAPLTGAPASPLLH